MVDIQNSKLRIGSTKIKDLIDLLKANKLTFFPGGEPKEDAKWQKYLYIKNSQYFFGFSENHFNQTSYKEITTKDLQIEPTRKPKRATVKKEKVEVAIGKKDLIEFVDKLGNEHIILVSFVRTQLEKPISYSGTILNGDNMSRNITVLATNAKRFKGTVTLKG